MKPFTFSLMLLLQRADDALRDERRKRRPDGRALALLRHRRRRIAERLRRPFAAPLTAGF